MKKFAVFALLICAAGCGSADSGGPPKRSGRPPTPRTPGWEITARRAIFSPDNRFVLVSYFGPRTPLGEMIPVYDLATGQKVHTFSSKDLAEFLVLPGTAHILARNKDGEINLWDMTNGKRLGTGPKFPRGAFPWPFSRDGKFALIAWGEEQGDEQRQEQVTYCIWDVKRGKEAHRWSRKGALGPAMFSPDGKWLFVTDNRKRKYEVLDVSTGKVVREEKWPGWQDPLAFSPDGKLAVSEGGDGKRGQMFLWDWRTRKLLQKLNFQGKARYPAYGGATSGAFSADGKRLIAAQGDLNLSCWDIASAKGLWSSEIMQDIKPVLNPTLWLTAFSPDGTRALTATGGWIERGEHSLRLRIWDCTNGTLLRELPPLPDGRGR